MPTSKFEIEVWQSCLQLARDGDTQFFRHLVRESTEVDLVTIPLAILEEMLNAFEVVAVAGSSRGRGRKPRFNRPTAALIRLFHQQDLSRGMTVTASTKRLAAKFEAKIGTIRDIVDRRKTYALVKRSESKETIRLRRKKQILP